MRYHLEVTQLLEQNNFSVVEYQPVVVVQVVDYLLFLQKVQKQL